MRFLILFLFLFSCAGAQAQPSWLLHKSFASKYYYVDSLMNISGSKNVTDFISQIKEYEKWALDNKDEELADEFVLLEYRIKIKNENLRYGLSESKLLELAATANKEGLNFLEADVLQMIGLYYWEKDKKSVASIEKYLTAYKIYKNYNPDDFPPKSDYLQALAATYYRYDDNENALKYFKEALVTKPASGRIQVYSIYNTIGLCYRRSKIYDSAVAYFKKIYDSAVRKNEKQWVAIAGGNIGISYYHQGRYAEAKPLLMLDIDISKANQAHEAAGSMAVLGAIYTLENKTDSAENILREALDICETKRFWPDYNLAEQIFTQLYKVYAVKDSMRLAYLYADSALAAKDTLDAGHNGLKLAKGEEKAEFLQHELQEEQIENQKKIAVFRRNCVIAGIFVALIIGVLVINRQRLIRRKLEAEKKNAESELEAASVKLEIFREIELQKKLVEEKNRELSQSLTDLEEAQTQLVQAEKMASLGQLTAGIAHEINNPVNFVSASIEPLRKDLEDIIEVISRYEQVVKDNALEGVFDKVEKYKQRIDIDFTKKETTDLLKGMEEGANRTADIVKGLRNFSRLDQNVLKPADLNEGLESTLTLLYPNYKNRIKIVKDLGDIPFINCFPGQINQVFMNIISNAIQAINGEGEIFIKTSANDRFVKISIRDTGSGMNKETISKIFDPFFTTKEVGKGTGLGLSISYGIIEKHKGTIEVFSEPGKGTEFVITIPFKQ